MISASEDDNSDVPTVMSLPVVSQSHVNPSGSTEQVSDSPSSDFLAEIRSKGGAAVLKKNEPEATPANDFLAEIRNKGGAAALKKNSEPETAPSNDFLAEIRNKGGAAALKKNTETPPPSNDFLA